MLATGMSSEDDGARDRAARRLLHRLEARMRLEQLAASPATASQEQRELERLKFYYLPMWSEWCRSTTLSRGLPTEVPFTDLMRPTVRQFDETDWLKKIDAEACRIVDQAVDELAGRGLAHARAALSVRYLNAASVAVFRSGRLVPLEPGQAEDLCDQVERALVPIVKRRGLLL